MAFNDTKVRILLVRLKEAEELNKKLRKDVDAALLAIDHHNYDPNHKEKEDKVVECQKVRDAQHSELLELRQAAKELLPSIQLALASMDMDISKWNNRKLKIDSQVDALKRDSELLASKMATIKKSADELRTLLPE